ncbi:MAG TPA: DoxX family protein [Candidatus Angelobacter sp.]|nr:DoxX family protein [Candidatus Angelobacter sp.]
MARKIVYWVSTGFIALGALMALSYLTNSPQVVQGFNHVGYPQQLRIILGIAKPLAAITLLVPGLGRFKEWAYAGLTFAWVCAFFAHYLAKDGVEALAPVLLLVMLAVSYFTRPASRQWAATATAKAA